MTVRIGAPLAGLTTAELVAMLPAEHADDGEGEGVRG